MSFQVPFCCFDVAAQKDKELIKHIECSDVLVECEQLTVGLLTPLKSFLILGPTHYRAS